MSIKKIEFRFFVNATLVQHAEIRFFFRREHVNPDVLGLACSCSFVLGGWLFVFFDFIRVQVREPP